MPSTQASLRRSSLATGSWSTGRHRSSSPTSSRLTGKTPYDLSEDSAVWRHHTSSNVALQVTRCHPHRLHFVVLLERLAPGQQEDIALDHRPASG
ncbi:hypothetical protein LSAT2_023281 [Lamellibrachia satsuma]|nr:hypothetical protein LSAT2_023281 [Lamellibrachia satsuma]